MTSKTTRRAILAGAAALPALTVPAIAADNPDAKLLRLGRELAAAIAAWSAALTRCDEVSDRVRATMRQYPDPELPLPKAPPEFTERAETLTGREAETLREFAPEHPLVTFYDASEAARNSPEFEAAYAPYGELYEQVLEDAGHFEARDHCNECYEKMQKIAEEIFATPARTIAGLAVKVQASDLLAPGENLGAADFVRFKPGASIAADIRAMAEA